MKKRGRQGQHHYIVWLRPVWATGDFVSERKKDITKGFMETLVYMDKTNPLLTHKRECKCIDPSDLINSLK